MTDPRQGLTPSMVQCMSCESASQHADHSNRVQPQSTDHAADKESLEHHRVKVETWAKPHLSAKIRARLSTP